MMFGALSNWLSSPASTDRHAIRAREGDPGSSPCVISKYVRTISIGFVCLIVVTAQGYAQPQNVQQHCRVVVSKAQFEKNGGQLVVVESPKLADFPPSFLCRTASCVGKADFHLRVLEDGSVWLMGQDHAYVRGPEGFPQANWRLDVVAGRLSKMRFEPPRMTGRPVCVDFDVWWDWNTPGKSEITNPR